MRIRRVHMHRISPIISSKEHRITNFERPLRSSFYSSLKDLPAYDSYNMQGRTYRYFNGKVQYPFGYGLSYSTFKYESGGGLKKAYTKTDTLKISLLVKNTGGLMLTKLFRPTLNIPKDSGCL